MIKIIEYIKVFVLNNYMLLLIMNTEAVYLDPLILPSIVNMTAS